jgi:hypothetical protein
MVDRDAPYSGLASIMAMNGRYGDTELVHMSKPEIRGLASIGELTINPETGLPEAFSLSSLLPIALNVGLGVATGGMSTMGQMALMGAVNFGLGKATGKSTKDSLFDGVFAAAGSGLSRAVGIGGSGSSAVKGGGKGGGTAGASAGTDALAGELVGNIGPNIATSGAVNTAPSGSFANPIQAAAGAIPNAGGLVGGSQGGASAYGNAVNNTVAPSSGIMDWISENPLKTAAGVGGLGGLLLSGDEQYPEEEPEEIEPFSKFKALGGDVKPENLNLSEEEIRRRNIEGFKDTEDAQYFTPLTYERLPSELNTGGLVGLDDNQGTSQSSGVANFLQPKQGNNNVITQQGVMDNMFSLGASAGKADEEEGVQSLVSPVDVVAPPENTGRLRLELLDGGKHRYVRDAPLVVEEPAEIIPVPDTNEELSDNAETDVDAGDTADPADAPPEDEDEESDAQGPASAAGGLISMLKKSKGGTMQYPRTSRDSSYKDSKNKNSFNLKDFNSIVELGVGYPELERMLNGETAASKSIAKRITATNPSSGAAGIFQFTPKAAKELGTSTAKIKKMTVKEQSDLYAKYLKRWKYKPGISLGMMQAAPSLINKPDDFVVYKKGSEAYEQNPGWVGGDGEITAGSIKRYYNKDNDVEQIKEEEEESGILDRISKLIKFSEGGTLEQYYQGQVIGKGDGMSDEILFDVEGRNPDMALLSRDEYVIPADVVSMIGNGSSNAGAEELDGFLKNVRQQSFGTRKQQREMTNPQKGLSALV